MPSAFIATCIASQDARSLCRRAASCAKEAVRSVVVCHLASCSTSTSIAIVAIRRHSMNAAIRIWLRDSRRQAGSRATRMARLA